MCGCVWYVVKGRQCAPQPVGVHYPQFLRLTEYTGIYTLAKAKFTYVKFANLHGEDYSV